MTFRLHYFLIFVSLSLPVFAEEVQLQLNSGTEISVRLYKAENPRAVILWIPTEHGIRGREDATAQALSKKGIEVWLADLHSSYFIPAGRSSYNNINIQDITDLIIKVSHNNQREVILFATGRAAPVALQAARQLQLTAAGRNTVKSAILLHPNFYASAAEAGKDMEYLPITYATNLSLYIMQPSLSGKLYQLRTIKEHLQKGGSDVIIQVLPKVSDGFNVRKPGNKTEERFYQKTPSMISNAIKLLESYSKPRSAAPLTKSTAVITPSPSSIKSGLQVYKGDIKEVYLNFKDFNSRLHTTENHRGEVLLVNFWATWCPPCVKELPSLNRLQKKINNKNFSILAVNVGEQSNTVKKFLSPMSIQFPVLTDPEGESVNPWKLLAFPSSFIIDKEGNIRYGLFGAIEWDNKEVVEIIQRLLTE